jgi:hypothetical protein
MAKAKQSPQQPLLRRPPPSSSSSSWTEEEEEEVEVDEDRSRRRRVLVVEEDDRPPSLSSSSFSIQQQATGGSRGHGSRNDIGAMLLAIVFFWSIIWAVFDSTTTSRIEEEGLNGKNSLPPDEFYVHRRNVTEREIAQFFFGHNEDNIDDKAVSLRKMSLLRQPDGANNTTTTKLILSHVPHTGMGATILTLFRALERAWSSDSGGSNLSVASLAQCWDVSAASILADTAYWINDRGSSHEGLYCAWMKTMMRTSDSNKPQGMTTQLLRSSNSRPKLHVIAGQVPYLGRPGEELDHGGGSGASSSSLLPPLQYVILVRNPALRVLSEIAARKRLSVLEDPMASSNSNNDNTTTMTTTLRWAAKQCVGYVRHELSLGRYAGGAVLSSLITPYQKTYVQQYRLTWTNERRVAVAVQNLQRSDGRILFGIIEQLSDTLDLLQYMVPDIPTSLIAYLQKQPQPQLQNDSDNNHKSNTTTTTASVGLTLWRQLQPAEQELVRSYCQYEQQVYDAVTSLHERQVAWVRQQTP